MKFLFSLLLFSFSTNCFLFAGGSLSTRSKAKRGLIIRARDKEKSCCKNNEEFKQLYPLHGLVKDNCSVAELFLFSKLYEKEFKALINTKDHRDRAPLHYAVENLSLENVKFLLSNGASPNVRNSLGETPLLRVLYALSFSSPSLKLPPNEEQCLYDILKILISYKASNVGTFSGVTPLKVIGEQENLKAYFEKQLHVYFEKKESL